MATYTSYDLVEFGRPLVARERPMPEPAGTQVLLRVRRSGVCHSDLHIAEGFSTSARKESSAWRTGE